MKKKLLRWLVILAALTVLGLWIQFSPPGLWGKAHAIGYAVCHQIDTRTFHIGGYALPLCARCSGMYFGAMLGLAFQAIVAPRRARFASLHRMWPFILTFLLFAIDGSNSYLYLLKSMDGLNITLPNLYTPSNTLRLFTGSGLGLSMAFFLFPAFNQTFWRTPIDEEPLTGKQIGLLFALTLALDGLILTESPLVLWPIAVISTLGVLILLTMIYGMAWIMIFKTDNTYTTLSEAWLPFLAGLTIAFLQIYVLDLLRYWLTGTWSGFSL